MDEMDKMGGVSDLERQRIDDLWRLTT